MVGLIIWKALATIGLIAIHTNVLYDVVKSMSNDKSGWTSISKTIIFLIWSASVFGTTFLMWWRT